MMVFSPLQEDYSSKFACFLVINLYLKVQLYEKILHLY